MLYLINHHCHTVFSDGKGTLEEMAEYAISKKMDALGFSDHAPIPNSELGYMTMDNLDTYLHHVDKIKSSHRQQLQIYKSLEVDYIPEVINVKSDHIVEADLDYTIGAVHYIDYFKNGNSWRFEGDFESGLKRIFDGNVKQVITRYYALIREMVQYFPPDIIAHLDRIKLWNLGNRYFNESDVWYVEEVERTLEVIAESNCILEINTRGNYSGHIQVIFPSPWILKRALEMDIPVHLASDAHTPQDILSGFSYAMDMIHKIGYKEMTIFLDNTWQSVPVKQSTIYVS